MPDCTEDDLVRVVTDLGGDHQVVPKNPVRDRLVAEGKNIHRPNRIEGHIEHASNDARANNRLIKWTTIEGGRVGWSIIIDVPHEGWEYQP